MATRSKSKRVGNIDPDRLYTYAELSELTGVPIDKLVTEVQHGHMGFIAVSPERRRMIEGQQYLDWREARRNDPWR